MDTQLSLRRPEILCLVIDEGGVTRAAERLMIAQPAVSSQIRALEKWLGAQLFARQRQQLVLTEAGHRAYAWAQEVLALSARVRRDVQELDTGAGGSVVIASSMAVGSYLLPPILTRLRLQRPGADITVHVDQPTPALHAVEVGDVDFAVLTMVDRDLPGTVIAEHLRDEQLVLCAGPGIPDANTVSIREAAALPCVGVPRTVAFHHELQAQLRDCRDGGGRGLARALRRPDPCEHGVPRRTGRVWVTGVGCAAGRVRTPGSAGGSGRLG